MGNLLTPALKKRHTCFINPGHNPCTGDVSLVPLQRLQLSSGGYVVAVVQLLHGDAGDGVRVECFDRFHYFLLRPLARKFKSLKVERRKIDGKVTW